MSHKFNHGQGTTGALATIAFLLVPHLLTYKRESKGGSKHASRAAGNRLSVMQAILFLG
jgi:hypothetical protein